MSGAVAQEVPIDEEASLDEHAQAIRALLEGDQILAAKREARRRAELFPDHPWLQQANRVLNPTRVVAVPARDQHVDWKKEYDWLRRNRDEYRGKWVALVEGELIACSDSFDDVVRQARERDLKVTPLVHRVE